ncbi:MAG: sugar phosphate isomerase/epimerase family protein [Spirosomataceae bacterium]
MQTNDTSRRNFLKNSVLVGAGLSVHAPTEATIAMPKNTHQFSFCLNTSTIREQNLGLMAEMETAAKAGYNGIEVWVSTVEKYVEKGGKLSDVRKKATDLGLTIEDAIGFSKWIVDDPTERAKALEQNKREMGMLAEIGCKRIAAPPFGATNMPGLNLNEAAARYAKLLELGDQSGVLPVLELWGFSANMHHLSEVVFVALESGHPKACILADVFHLYNGKSPFVGLQKLSGSMLPIFHMNDYPAEPAIGTINDSYRVFPGDGVAPLNQILKDLHAKNTPIVLSLELFNKEYWKMNALDAAKMGLTKMKAAVAKALAS